MGLQTGVGVSNLYRQIIAMEMSFFQRREYSLTVPYEAGKGASAPQLK